MPADPPTNPPSPATQATQPASPPTGTLGKLEDKIKEIGHRAGEAVTGAIRSVKDGAHAVQDAIGHASADAATYVKRAVDIRRHVRTHPWLAVGCAVTLGFVCSGLLSRR